MSKDYLKPVRDLVFDFVYEGCPVALSSGCLLTDVEDQSLYLSLTFKNVSEKTVTGLAAEVWLYYTEKANLPDEKMKIEYDLTRAPEGFYTAEGRRFGSRVAAPGRDFGSDYYYPVNESRFDRMNVMIKRVDYSDNTSQSFSSLPVTGFSKMEESFGEFEKKAYERINLYSKLEHKFPAKVLPMVNSQLWICCCGAKNKLERETCDVCGRDKMWQLANLNMEAIENTAQELREERSADVAFITKMQDRSNVTVKSQQQDIERIRREQKEAMLHVRKQQRRSDFKKKIAIILFVLWIAVSLIVFFMSHR
ncbi:MAG: hypothetical protein IJV00_05775 [Clostridia bacterium]|nr:hypothetical protein [Clostridia bacterium]